MPQNYKMVATKTCLYATQSLDMELDQLSLLIRFEHFFYHWGGDLQNFESKESLDECSSPHEQQH